MGTTMPCLIKEEDLNRDQIMPTMAIMTDSEQDDQYDDVITSIESKYGNINGQQQQQLNHKDYTDQVADNLNQKIETLKNEKKNMFKQMLREKKNVSKLEDLIEDYKSKIAKMEQQIQDIKYEKKKAKDNENQQHHHSTSSKSNKKSNKDSPFQSTLAGINIPTIQLLDIDDHKPSHKRHADDNETDGDIEGDSTTDYSSDEGDLERKTTEILDISHDAPTEAALVYSWIYGQS